MSVFQPVDVREPDARRKRTLQKMMQQALAARGSRGGSLITAAGRQFKGANMLPKPHVTQQNNVAQSVLAGLGVIGHSRPEETSPGPGQPIPAPRPVTPGPPVQGNPIPIHAQPGAGPIAGDPSLGGSPAPGGSPTGGGAAAPGDLMTGPTPGTSPLPHDMPNLVGSVQLPSAAANVDLSNVIPLGGGWVFDPHLGKTYQLPDGTDPSQLNNPFRFGG